MSRTVYEIINPSDKATLVASDHEVAAMACFSIGSGRYALKPIDGPLPEVPLFLFGGALEWFEETFGRPFGEAVEARRTEIADCLDTVMLGNRTDAEMAEKYMDDAGRRAFRAELNEKRRTSLNNICGRAIACADSLRKAAAEAAA